MSRVILVRHGETVLNQKLRYSGQQETPLTALGEAQHEQVRTRLLDEHIARVVCSDLSRSQLLADRIAADHGVSAESEPELREASFGTWEGLTYEAAMARDRAAMVAFNRNPAVSGPPGGESLTALEKRLRACFDLLLLAHKDHVGVPSTTPHDSAPGALLLVSHGGALRTLLCSLLAIPLDRYWTLRIDPASITILDTYPLGAIVSVLNDTCHLHGLGS